MHVFYEHFMKTNVLIYFTYVHIVIMYVVVLRSKDFILHSRQHCAITILNSLEYCAWTARMPFRIKKSRFHSHSEPISVKLNNAEISDDKQ